MVSSCKQVVNFQNVADIKDELGDEFGSLSEIKSVGRPKLKSQRATDVRATEIAEMFFSGKVFTSLVNLSTMTRRYLFTPVVQTNYPST